MNALTSLHRPATRRGFLTEVGRGMLVASVGLETAAGLGLASPSALAADPPATAPTKPQTPAQRAFERFKRLSGEWRGQSTKGWTDTSSFRAIAGGSCVLSMSFDAHPNESMATLFHMDGQHLMLTHYCIAKNQPRMAATEIGEDGRTVLFTFLDGLNIPTRDTGHMDKAFFRFVDENTFVSRWTWYEKGKEQWFEDITYVRETPTSDARKP